VTVTFGIYSNWFRTPLSMSVERVYVLVWYLIKLVEILMSHAAAVLINLLILFVKKLMCFTKHYARVYITPASYTEGSGFKYRLGNLLL
jgi:hypothetical protein